MSDELTDQKRLINGRSAMETRLLLHAKTSETRLLRVYVRAIELDTTMVRTT